MEDITLKQYLSDIETNVLKPLGILPDVIGNIVGHNSHFWKERQIMADISIPVNNFTRKMLNGYIPYYNVSEITFRLFYYKTDKEEGTFWFKK